MRPSDSNAEFSDFEKEGIGLEDYHRHSKC
jgi:hypothetical protein